MSDFKTNEWTKCSYILRMAIDECAITITFSSGSRGIRGGRGGGGLGEQVGTVSEEEEAHEVVGDPK
jgi:hypothetical protein